MAKQRRATDAIVLTALVAAVATAMIITGLNARVPDLYRYFLGDLGILPFIVGVATLLMLIIGARQTRESLMISQRSEMATRFQKGLELLGSASPTTRVGGIGLAVSVAELDPSYRSAALNALTMYFRELDADPRSEAANNRVPLNPNDPTTGRALSALMTLRAGANWPEDCPTRDGRLLIYGLYACRFSRRGDDFSNIAFHHAYLANARFIQCSFANAVIRFRAAGMVKFEKCDMRGAVLNLVASGPSEGAVALDQIYFDRCQIEGCKINGIALSEHIQGQRKGVRPPYLIPEA